MIDAFSSIVKNLQNSFAPPVGLNASSALSLLIGAILLVLAMRDSFAALSESTRKKLTRIYGYDLTLSARDFAHPIRYHRARGLYVIFFLVLYVILSLLGINAVTKSGLIPASFAALLPSADAFPLVLALAFQAGSPLLPNMFNLEMKIRGWLHELIAIPDEVQEIMAKHHKDTIDNIRSASEVAYARSGESRSLISIKYEMTLSKTIALCRLGRNLGPHVTNRIPDDCVAKISDYLQRVEDKVKAHKSDLMSNEQPTETSLRVLESCLRDALLATACLIATTPPDHREVILQTLGLNAEVTGYRLNWHDNLSSQMLSAFVLFLLVCAFGGELGRE